uniref:Uncharacterized protein n=1 Tax=viral metagenome TaxID=1070528 RepID=A0A6M3J1B5_9ZZZZ
MKAFIHFKWEKKEIVLKNPDKANKESIAKQLSEFLSNASSFYIEFKDGTFLIIPEQAFVDVCFTVED